jgi:cation transport ATPase
MWMFKFTSDHSTRVEWVTKLLGIDDMNLGPKPEDKLNQVIHLSQQNGRHFYFFL